MNPGEFRHTTRIKLNTETQQSDYGDFKNTSNNSIDRFCKIKWLPGNEKIENEVIGQQINIEFTYRYESLVQHINRIDVINYTHGGQTLNFYIKDFQYKGLGNQQYIIIKAHTLQN